MSNWTIVLSSPQMSCVQTWRSNLIALSPTAPVMVLKRFQVCANCCFSNGDTKHWQNSSTTESALCFFRAFPTLSFFFLHEEKLFICKDLESFHSQFPLFPSDWKLNWFYSWLGKCYSSATFIFCLVSRCHYKNSIYLQKQNVVRFEFTNIFLLYIAANHFVDQHAVFYIKKIN